MLSHGPVLRSWLLGQCNFTEWTATNRISVPVYGLERWRTGYHYTRAAREKYEGLRHGFWHWHLEDWVVG